MAPMSPLAARAASEVIASASSEAIAAAAPFGPLSPFWVDVSTQVGAQTAVVSGFLALVLVGALVGMLLADVCRQVRGGCSDEQSYVQVVTQPRVAERIAAARSRVERREKKSSPPPSPSSSPAVSSSSSSPDDSTDGSVAAVVPPIAPAPATTEGLSSSSSSVASSSSSPPVPVVVVSPPPPSPPCQAAVYKSLLLDDEQDVKGTGPAVPLPASRRSSTSSRYSGAVASPIAGRLLDAPL